MELIMYYRTRTYIAADWDGDKDAVSQLKQWNEDERRSLSFTDVHEATQSSDDSLNCSIKASLSKRMDMSKTFVLIVGDGTRSRKAGECTYCPNYSNGICRTGHTISNDSFIEYECKKAVRDKESIQIIVLYNSTKVDKSKCPDSIKDYGIHSPMHLYRDGKYFWDYQSIKQTFENCDNRR